MDRNALYQRWAGVVAVLLCIAVFIAMKPIAVPLVLAAWTATLAQPIHRKLGGGGVAAGAMTAVLIVALIAILGLLYAFLAQGAAGLASSLERADSPQAAFEALVTPGEAPADLGALKKMNQEHPEFGKYAALLGIGTVLFLFFLALGTVGLLTGGEKLYAWLQKHAPLRADHFDRLGDAFTETGRGLFTSIGLTCLIQGLLCTITFAALSVPRPLVLGFICALFAILPVVGAPLVWIPVAIGLFITGATVKGVILLAVGGGVIAVIEVVIGPMLAKLGRFKLDGGLILLSMFGGALGLGPGGLVLGPLVFRLAKEAAQLWRESAA
ncbi:MAG: AI-2E family transporter [Deltaproteobacteria bacterium]|nr:MAG: AI-2E family transporter [Deltaproteobacteria bacterium]